MISLSVFTLPFNYRETPFDWLIVCLILINIVSLIALFAAYIEFKVHPPLKKYQIRNVNEYLRYFKGIKYDMINAVVAIDIFIGLIYTFLIAVKFIHLIIFG